MAAHYASYAALLDTSYPLLNYILCYLFLPFLPMKNRVLEAFGSMPIHKDCLHISIEDMCLSHIVYIGLSYTHCWP